MINFDCHTGPGGHPTGIKVVSKGSDFITYSWKELSCNQLNGPIIGYRVAYYWSRDEKSIPFCRSFNTRSTKYKAAPLNSNTVYSFQVAAYNRVGMGDFSPPFIVKTYPAPTGWLKYSPMSLTSTFCIVK